MYPQYNKTTSTLAKEYTEAKAAVVAAVQAEGAVRRVEERAIHTARQILCEGHWSSGDRVALARMLLEGKVVVP